MLLLLAVICSASLPLLFRAFHDLRVSILWAIPANYFTCVTLGLVFAGNPFGSLALRSESWIYFSVLQGIFLAGNFYLLAFTAQRAGVSVAVLASRLSVAIPVLLAFWLYGDSIRPLKIVGLTAALASLYLCSAGGDIIHALRPFSSPFLPAIVFLCFGFHFSLLKFVQEFHLNAASHHPYVMFSFFFAFLVSTGVVLQRISVGGADFRLRHLLWGLVLGVMNYGAIYFLVRVLSLEEWESSQIFPVYSVSVVVVSSVLAFVLFRERLPRMKKLGLLIGLIAVALLHR